MFRELVAAVQQRYWSLRMNGGFTGGWESLGIVGRVTVTLILPVRIAHRGVADGAQRQLARPEPVEACPERLPCRQSKGA